MYPNKNYIHYIERNGWIFGTWNACKHWSIWDAFFVLCSRLWKVKSAAIYPQQMTVLLLGMILYTHHLSPHWENFHELIFCIHIIDLMNIQGGTKIWCMIKVILAEWQNVLNTYFLLSLLPVPVVCVCVHTRSSVMLRLKSMHLSTFLCRISCNVIVVAFMHYWILFSTCAFGPPCV